MKTIIFYKSYLGATKKYANWLAEATGATAYKFGQYRSDLLKDVDAVVVMSGTYASKMPLTKFLQAHWDELKDKKVFAVAAGGAPADVEYSKQQWKLVPKEILENIKHWKVPGKFMGPNKPNPQSLQPIIDKLK